MFEGLSILLTKSNGAKFRINIAFIGMAISPEHPIAAEVGTCNVGAILTLINDEDIEILETHDEVYDKADFARSEIVHKMQTQICEIKRRYP